ncbi:hypothetical protein PHYSODRAFT_525623 [Phytophthora sojae]|uniref:Uncharacterized protein n=1 Tax=Phytophthora sojae (strain P6497) TaxID=1094619 RepID=G5A6U5_PHYSP|nr:hypothetical protein PHYSODRAFT_525623 [Phytophthora sojae]EGZ09050.1 hypothetical protein PHYSODRAFT_525623 [Phytophthora sojae]|eukprot:XP_009535683.1 hypothetical protein PHYSODRAFT_525623 [Phytophthora sojae]
MSTKALIPGNSQRARSTALNAFERFAVAEGFTVNAIYKFVGGDSTGDTLYIVLDKFAVYLAFKESSKSSLLSKNSVASYFGNVKNHLLELFPALSAVSGRRLQKIASILDKYCSKRGTDFTHQAPPCTKSDLRSLSLAILKGAVSVQDYQDAALLNILWYLLGRSSDTMCLVKNQVAVYPGGCLFITFKRMKSASYQGASIFHDPNDFSSCPIHALALATIMQSTPSEFLMDQLPRDTQELLPTEIGETPLRELLDARTRSPATSNSESPTPKAPANKATVPGIHAYVNRVLQKWSGVCQTEGTNLTPGLSSHSFRRGAAQNANSDSKISTPWILDRGGWSMSAVSKAFNYIVGTTQEDQTVGKSLAGWGLKASPRLPTLDDFDPLVLHRIRLLQDRFFSAAKGFTERLSLRDDVVDVLTATAILHYPDMLRLRPESLYIKRVQEALSQVQATEAEIAAWSMAIHRTLQPSKNDTPRSPAPRRAEDDELLRRQTLLLEQQAQILGGLAAEVKALNQQVQRLEHPSDLTTAPSTTAAGSLSSSSSALSDTASGAATRAH